MWAVVLDSLLGHLERFRSLLSVDELQCASRFRFERDATRFAIGRAVVRRLLGEYLGTDPKDVRLTYGSHGKPALGLSTREPAPLQFNLAHSGGFALLTVTRDYEHGVDVERVHVFDDMPGVMRVSFVAAERMDIEQLPDAERIHAFYRCWTRKEAVLKALGWGMAKPLHSFRVTVDKNDARLLEMEGENRDVLRWQIVHLTPATGYIGAVAWQGRPLMLRCHTYAP